MKSATRILVLTVVLIGLKAATAQQPPANAIDPNAPVLTLEEKITLGTDDIKRGDLIERLQKQFLAESKPINDHQEAAKALIEKDHPGWSLVSSQPQGWHFEKKPEPKPANKKPEQPKK